MKKIYEEPKADILNYNLYDDVFTASGLDGGDEYGDLEF